MDSFIYGMNVSDIFSCHHGYVLREKLCVECAAGSYYDASEKSCKLCPLNTYSLTSKQTACTPCSGSNNITLQEGSNNISDCKVRCEKGQMLENNICVPCPPNFYQDQTGKHYCLPCPVHTASTSYGSQSVSDCKDICPPGTQLNSSINQCDLCPRGTYRDGTLQDQCKSCPTNATTLKEGSESSDSCNIPLCQPGQFANVTTLECENCSIGSYQPEEAALSCHSCPDNHTTVYEGTQNSDQCKFVCQAPGQEINPANSSTCRLCLRGYYRTGGFDERFANCTKCSGDNTTDVEGATNSAYCNIPICSAGQHISNNKCEACTHDTYQPMDEPYSTTNCTRCGDGLGTVNIASTHKDNCTSFCQPGYGKNGSDCQLCDRGTWNNGNTSLRFEKCQQCRTNYTTEVTGATDLANCTLRKCEPGYKIVGDDCIQCPVGEYQPESNNDTCLKCRNGTSTNSTGSTNETDCTIFCGAGQEGTENDTCVNCSDDEFKTTAGYGPCEMCTGDFTSTPTNRTACTQVHCDKGRELNNTTCQNCQIGFYKDFRGNQSCVPCPANHTTISGGSTHKNNCSVVYCAPGFYSSDNKSCLACDVGFYKSTPGNEACTQCPANWTTHEIASNSISQCSLVLCPLGYVRLNNSQCRPCEKGSYQNGSSQTQCTHCGPINGYNTSTNNTASQNESYCFPVCPEGKIVNISTRSCDQCPYGSYKSHSGLDTFCTRCKDGWTTGVLGATSEDACKIEICDKGFYRPNSTAACKKCPFGTYQDQRDFKEVGECKKCQDNETTLMEGATSLASCIPLCKAGQEYNLISNNCTSCPVGQYKGENDLPSVCKYCLQNETTSSHGAVRCISSITTPPPSYKINVTVDVFATVTCDNPEQTRGALTKALIDMIRSARKLYYSDLCPTDSCANVVVVMVKFCDTQTVKRQANRNAQASVTVRELDSRLRNILYNFHRSAISAVLEALRDHSSVENILAVNQIILELARLVGCPTGNIMEITFTCRHCPIGYFSSNNVCVPCSNGSYSTLPVSDKCLQCNAGETTEKPGSSNKSECIGICKVDNKYCGSNGECITQDGKYQCSCNEYYEGPQCAVRKPSEDSSIGVVVGVSVGVGVLLLLALLIVGICLLRKKRQRKSQPSIASTQDFVNNTYPYMGGPVMMMENPASGMMDPTMYGTELVPFYGQESHLYRSEKRYSSHDSEDDMRNFSLYRKDRNY
ncbi:proprotein convertase subtilisin/kexin type 5-like [Physella acuta]|uniref:proprotein convertase subtilisin/kexin type 5-like n=1 Tax=Physella acuta TaxID=109671 RepID=UPI0027DD4B34|nr:proprotein convertase subtilisin/kexin type 5-like [Physella acuta]